MARPRQVACLTLLFAGMACAPVGVQAQTLELLIRDTLATHPSTQSQRACVAQAVVGERRADLSVLKYLFKPIYKAFGGAMNEC